MNEKPIRKTTAWMDNNVKVAIYKKMKPINEPDILQLSELLRRYYPDQEYIYKPGESRYEY